jgi:hypothetical protein
MKSLWASIQGDPVFMRREARAQEENPVETRVVEENLSRTDLSPAGEYVS